MENTMVVVVKHGFEREFCEEIERKVAELRLDQVIFMGELTHSNTYDLSEENEMKKLSRCAQETIISEISDEAAKYEKLLVFLKISGIRCSIIQSAYETEFNDFVESLPIGDERYFSYQQLFKMGNYTEYRGWAFGSEFMCFSTYDSLKKPLRIPLNGKPRRKKILLFANTNKEHLSFDMFKKICPDKIFCLGDESASIVNYCDKEVEVNSFPNNSITIVEY